MGSIPPVRAPVGARPRPRGGFTLLEVVLALIVLGIAVVGVTQGFAVGLRAAAIARDTTTATSLARARLAELDAGLLPVSRGAEGTFEDYGAPDVAWTLDSRSTQYPGLYELTLRVTWTDRGGTRDLTVVRWMLDRQVGALSALQAGAAAAASKPKSTSTGTTKSPGR
jgi:type II secretion system protein I